MDLGLRCSSLSDACAEGDGLLRRPRRRQDGHRRRDQEGVSPFYNLRQISEFITFMSSTLGKSWLTIGS